MCSVPFSLIVGVVCVFEWCLSNSDGDGVWVFWVEYGAHSGMWSSLGLVPGCSSGSSGSGCSALLELWILGREVIYLLH